MTIPIGVIVHDSDYPMFANSKRMYTIALFDHMALTACAAADFTDHHGCTEITVYFDTGDTLDCNLYLLGVNGDYGVQDKLAQMMIMANDEGDEKTRQWFQKLKLLTH